MERTVELNGQTMVMRASALIPRLYRHYFNRDMIVDMQKLRKAYAKTESLPDDATEDEQAEVALTSLDLTIFENMAWLFLKHGGNDVGNSPDEWLDSIDGVFSIYEVMPVLMELWDANNVQTSTPRKK